MSLTPSLLLVVLAQPAWPAPDAPLDATPLPDAPARMRVYLDAGHGAGANTGASSAFCTPEETFTLALAEQVAEDLRATGRFDVRVSRTATTRPTYPARLAAAKRFRADVLVSLHFDVRGLASWWEPQPGLRCLRQDATPGFALLYADEPAGRPVAERARLARAIAARMSAAGFLPYDGVDYPGLYDPDPLEPGAFIARQPKGRRIYLLRQPRLPSVIVETHDALNVEETQRWGEPRVRLAFAQALATALLDFKRAAPVVGTR